MEKISNEQKEIINNAKKYITDTLRTKSNVQKKGL